MDDYSNADPAVDDSIDVTINVTNVNEPPEFDSNAPTTLNVVENTAAGENIGTAITAADPDNGDTVTYSLDKGDGAAFEIDSSGQIKTKDPLDRETKSSYIVTVTATDSESATATHRVTITVTDEEHEPPRFDEEYGDGEASLAREVAEDTAAGQPVGAPVSATDDDGDTLTYSLVGTGATSFDIDTTTGQIKTKDPLDYEDTQSYSVTVSVTDSKDSAGNTENTPAEDASIDVTINVTDVNEGPAFADDAPTTLSVDENTATNTDITDGRFTATDPESDTPTYSLSGTDAASFDIDTSTGDLKTKADLDHEAKDSYSVTIQVTDGKAADGTTEGTATIDDIHNVTITVTDVDEDGTITFSLDPPSVGTKLTATLTDDDGVKTSPAVTWVWESSPNGTGTWTVISGETTGSYTPSTDDVGNHLRVTATYDDEKGSDKTAQKVSQKVLTAPPTNLQPSFTDASTTRSVAENTRASQNIGAPVSATHSDSVGRLVYSLGGTDAASFDIVASTGQLKTKTVFDYETDTKTRYTVTVSVSDGMDDYSNTDTAVDDTISVTISITDVNEGPAFADDAPATQTVGENTAPDSYIGSPYTATDPDTTNDTLTYSLGGTDAASFGIDTTTGQLKTKSALDHETKASYNVTIRVTDNKAPDGTASATIDDTHTVTITVTDEDDPGTITISADPPSAGTTLTATLTDDDGIKATPAATWVWESSPNGTSSWTPISGEATNSYTPGTDDVDDYLRVTATYDDEEGSGKTAEKVSQKVLTAPPTNLQPSFTDASTTRSVAENTRASQNIGAPVSATHSDSVGRLVYSLGGTDAASFDIVASTGQLKTKTVFDYETDTKTRYTVTVSVSDGMDDYSNTDTAADDTVTVTINVTDVNEPPAFNTGLDTSLEVAENTDADTNIGDVFTATDPDNTNDTLTYGLSGSYAGSFTIDDATGQLKTKADLDFEVKSSYSINITVRDSKNAGGTPDMATDDTHAVTITVTDVDDPGKITFSSDNPAAGTTLTAILTDDDGVKTTPAVTWAWESSTDQTNWTPISGETTDNITLDADDIGKYYKVTATYDDDEDSGQTATGETAKAVVDRPATNKHPGFADATAGRSVAENTTAGQNIGAPVSATHSDSVGRLVYSLGGTDAASFDIGTSTGQLKTKTVFDYESDARSYTVTVSVTDGMDDYSNTDTAVDDTISVTISITDVNEGPTFNSSNTATREVAENTASNTAFGGAFPVTDQESDTLTYSLGGTDAASFGIDTTTGQLKTKSALDHETKASYNVTIRVTDNKAPDGTASATIDATHAVTITVTDVDDDGAITLSADPPSAGTTLTAILTDDDGIKATPAVTWKWESSPNGTSSWTPISGEATNSYTPGTDDVDDYLRVTATYDDEEGSGKTAEKVSQKVLTAPPTNLQPSFTDASTTRSVAENTRASQNIGAPVSATHSDSVGRLVYSLGGTDAASFDIVASTGQLKTKTVFDYETDTKTRYTVTVSVSDGMDDYSNTDTAVDDTISVTISITDVNEGPTFNSSNTATREVAENTASNTAFGGAFPVTDQESDTPTYSLGGTHAASFGIDTTTGQLKTKADLDYEDKNRYSVTIQVTDGLNAEGNTETNATIDATHAVTITVTDVDDPGKITFSSDNPAAGTTLTAILTDDDGVKSSPAVTWTWESSTDGNNWTGMSGETTDSITLDADDIGNYYRVTATYDDDEDSGQTATGETANAVVDRPEANEHPEFASDASTTRSVAENTPAGQNIGDPVAATHPDSLGTLVYSLNAAGATNFAIDSSTGQLKTKTGVDLDYETTQSYTVTVSVTDGLDDYSSADSAVDDTITVTINVTNIDIPAIPEQPAVTATTGSAAGLTVSWTALTSTETAPVDGYDVQYREKDANPVDDWSEVSVTTNSATITGLDYSKTYEVQVRSKNSEGESGWSNSGEGSTPQLLNVTFSSGTYRATEGSSVTITVNVSPTADRVLSIPISVTDGSAESDDYEVSGTPLTFAIGDSTKMFTISANNDSDRDDETVNLAFGTLPDAVEGGTPETATLTIDDTTLETKTNTGGGNGGNGGGSKDVGGSGGYYAPISTVPTIIVPSFTEGTSTERTVAEGTVAGVKIGSSVSATGSGKLTYSLEGADAKSFDIDAATGQLKTKAVLDYEVKSRYVVSVAVSGKTGNAAYITVIIHVTDVVEVAATNPDTETVALVDPEEETEVATPDGKVTVTFPAGSRPGPFFVSVDSNPAECDWDSLDDPPAEQLLECVTVEIFDTHGNPIEGGNVLDQPITIEINLDGDDIGEDTIGVFTKSGGQWPAVDFTQTTGDDGDVTVAVGGITGPGTYAVGASAPQQVISEVPTPVPATGSRLSARSVESPTTTPEPKTVPLPAPKPTATPEPTAEPTPEPTATPTQAPTPTPAPVPTQAPTPTAAPTPTPTAVPQPTEVPEQPKAVLLQGEEFGSSSRSSFSQASPSPLPEDLGRLRIWPIILLTLGAALEVIAIGVFVREEMQEKQNRMDLSKM